MTKLTTRDLQYKKINNEIVSWLTCYDYSFATALNETELDLILVGDSGGMVALGYKNTNPVTMDEMIMLSSAVRRGAPDKFIIGDMPKGSYESSITDAINNAMRFAKEADCDAVKLEGGIQMIDQIKAISKSGIPVFGHIGLTPQSSNSFGGYRVVGKNEIERKKLFEDASALKDAGAVAILIEATPDGLASEIAAKIEIPIYGIGAGTGVDGHLLIFHDLLGVYPTFRPKFAPCLVPQIIQSFINTLDNQTNIEEFGRQTRRDGFWELTRLAVSQFAEMVKNKDYPTEQYLYKRN